MRSMILFVFMPAFVLFILPLLLPASLGVDTTIVLAVQLLAVALNHGALVHLMRELIERCRLAHARAGDLLGGGGINPSHIAKGRRLERDYVLLALEVEHHARWYPPYLALASVIYAAGALGIWCVGYLPDDLGARAAIVAPTMFVSALLLCSERRHARDALAEMDGNDSCS